MEVRKNMSMPAIYEKKIEDKGVAKKVYDMLALRFKEPVLHCLSLLREGSSHEELEGVVFKERAKDQSYKSGLWRIYSAGVVYKNGREVGVFASKYVYDEESSDSERSVFIVLKEPVIMLKHRGGAWRERRIRGGFVQYESVPFEETVKVSAPIDPQLVEEVLEMLKP